MVIVDEEFKNLIPPLSEDEYKQLEENCLKDGIRDALVVWPQEDGTDILIDGHNRWSILGKHINLLHPQFRHIQFETREEAKEWIIRNQFGRRNLSAYDRSLLALKLKPMIAEKAKENQASHTEQGYQKSDKAVTTTKELAKVAGVSHDTIHKVEKIQEKASEQDKADLRAGSKSINEVYNKIREPLTSMHSLSYQAKQDEQKAIQRHKEFEKKKEQDNVIDLKEAQQDIQDKDIFLETLKEDLMKQLNNINSIFICNEEDAYKQMFESLGSIDSSKMKEKIYKAQRTLTRLLILEEKK